MEGATIASMRDYVERKKLLRRRVTKYISFTICIVIVTLVIQIANHVYALRKEYPIAFKWYEETFGLFYPSHGAKTKQLPGECFRSMWSVCLQLTYSSLQNNLCLLAMSETTKPEQAMFLYLCAHHFGGDKKYNLTAEKWDYPSSSMGLDSPWYKGLVQDFLPIPYTNQAGVSSTPKEVQEKMWASWQATKAQNPFYEFFQDKMDEFFGLPVVNQYAFKRRGRLTCDLEYLYFGGICMVAEMCIIDTESTMSTFNRFFKAQYLNDCGCGARMVASSVSSGVNAAAACAMTPGMDVMMAAFPEGTAAALGIMAVSGTVGAIAGAGIAKNECDLEFDKWIGKMV